MGKFDPFIPLAKQIVNKVKRSDSGLTIPDWYQARQVPIPTGKFNPGAAEVKTVEKGKTLGFFPGNAKELSVEKGKKREFNPGGNYKAPKKEANAFGKYAKMVEQTK